MDSKQNSGIKQNVYDIVTEKIISLLEAGTIPWKQPWGETSMPQNLISKRPYHGVNLLLLSSLGYEKNYFLTFDQVQKMNGKIRKGEHGNIVVFYTTKKKAPLEQDEEELRKRKMILRYYRVFNIDQCEFPKPLPLPAVKPPNDPIAACEAVILKCPGRLQITHTQPEAFYNSILDFINMPRNEMFCSNEAYFDCLYHELVHWSGHITRLNRPGIVNLKNRTEELYSFEELIAQLGASFLSNHTGILQPTIENSAAYIARWLEVFRNDRRFIVKASAAAQRAVDYILQTNQEDSSTIEQSEMIVGDKE